MFDLDPARGCLGSSVGKSICPECRVSWVQIPPEATHFSFFHLPQVSVFLSYFLSISSVVMHIIFTLSRNSLCNIFTESLTRTLKDQCDSIKKTHNILTHNITRTSDKQLIQELN